MTPLIERAVKAYSAARHPADKPGTTEDHTVGLQAVLNLFNPVLKQVKSLITDIESMRDPNYEEPYFGPFSEFDHDFESASVEWPNLAISLEDVQKALQEHEANG